MLQILNVGIKTFFFGKNKGIKGGFNMANMLTTKEATLIADLLTYEEQACKKARLYSKTLTSKELSATFTKIADNHEKRFNALLNML